MTKKSKSVIETISGIFLYVVMIAMMAFITMLSYTTMNLTKDDLSYVTTTITDISEDKYGYDLKCSDGNNYEVPDNMLSEDIEEYVKIGDSIYIAIVNDDTDVIELSVNGKQIYTLEDTIDDAKESFTFQVIVVAGVVVLPPIGMVLSNYFKKKNRAKKLALAETINNESVDDEIYKAVQASVSKRNGFYYFDFSIDEVYDEANTKTIAYAIMDLIEENKIALFIEEQNEEFAQLYYKSNGKLMESWLFKDKKTRLYHVYSIPEEWYFPYAEEMLEQDRENVLNALDEFIAFNSDVIKKDKTFKK